MLLALRLLAEGKAVMTDGRTVYSDSDHIIENAGETLASPSAVREAVDLEALARFTP